MDIQRWFTEPLQYGEWTLPGRLVLAPINTGFAKSGHPISALRNFHSARSGPPLAICYVGNVATSAGGATNVGTLIIGHQHSQQGFAEIAATIAERGSLPGIQIAQSPKLDARKNWRVYDVTSETRRLSEIITSLRQDDLRRAFNQFVQSARVAVRLGFKVVQIHAAHGYLLSLLLSEQFNPRSDDYRPYGPRLSELVARLREVTATVLLAFRFNIQSGLGFENGLAEGLDLAAFFSKEGVDILDLSAGIYTLDRRLIYPGSPGGSMPYLSAGLKIAAAHTHQIITASGNLTDTRQLQRVPRNVLIGVARALIADPDFASKSARDDQNSIVECARRGRCHYFSRGRTHIECGVNGQLGRRES